MPSFLEAVVAGAKAEDLGDAEVLTSGYIEVDGQRAWRREMVMRGDERLRTVQQVMLVGEHVVTVLTGGPAKRWKKRARMVASTLDGIRISPPPADDGERASAAADRPPTTLIARQPALPAELAASGIAGEVVLRVRVDAEGKLGDDITVVTSPDARLDAAAIEAVRGWRFRPALRAGEPVATDHEITVTFRAP